METAFLPAHLAQDEIQGAAYHPVIILLASTPKGLPVGARDEGVVIDDFLELLYTALEVGRLWVKTGAVLVMDSTASHRIVCIQRHVWG